jgi:quinol-cytochrome oxidoreductase complex cytochrome b subunit
MKEKIYRWLDDRLGISAVTELASHKTVPVHRYSVFYYLGGMTLFFFLVQVCTGILLMLYYRPSAEEAFESVEFLMTTVPFGWLIRSIHSWSANLMVFFAFLHMVSVFFMKAYRAPRELTWVTGVLIFLLVLAFGFSGYLLPWNQLAFFATKVGTDIAGVVPGVGHWVLRFLRGGDRVTGGTLSRFYGWHVAILPAITTLLLVAHVLLVQVKGMSVPPAMEKDPAPRKPMKFFPHFALRDLTGWVIALAVLASLAALFPWELGEKADAFAPAYENIRPEWYYVFMFQSLKLVPGGEIFGVEYEAIPIVLFGLGAAVLIGVPFLDRNVLKRGKSPMFTIAGIVVLIYMLVMTCWGYASALPLYIAGATAVLLGLVAWITRPRAEGGSSTSNRIAMTTGIIALLVMAFAASASAAPPPPKTSCIGCHVQSEMFDAAAKAKLAHYNDDVHTSLGLSCHDCHGGNPDPKLAGDPSSMDPAFKPNPFVGKPARAAIPQFCGKCHSSAAYMKRYNPSARVDIVDEYHTSKHGQLLVKGDENVATCTDCHSVHGILRKSNPKSTIYPTHVAETCGRCHSDAKRMASYKDDFGRPLPTDQFARWKGSVHANAMFAKGDLTAPTCNDCHGNHGATPPGLESVSFVCGTCHAREAELFRKSPKHEGFQTHNANFLSTGSSCGDCHPGTAPEVQSIKRFSECIVCHQNHGVARPTVALFGNLPETPCAFCHEGTGPLVSPEPEPKEKQTHYRELRDTLLAAAKRQNLKGDAKFDWLVDQAQQLPTHVVTSGAKKQQLRPEFARLFEKFRIGKTHVDGVKVRQCADCHIDPTSNGAKTAQQFLGAASHLTAATARSERILLGAARGGVGVRNARAELDEAVDAQIEMEALVHGFSAAGPFAEKEKEAATHAKAALEAGKKSLAELSFRRRGLLAALGIICVVLTGLIFKIRTLGG